MPARIAFLSTLLLSSYVAAQSTSSPFSLYPSVDPNKLAASFGISTDCLDALNSSLTCDPSIFSFTADVDNYWWQADDLTTLCTSDCADDIQMWTTDVYYRCWGQNITVFGRQVPAETVSNRYADGYGLACLTSDIYNSSVPLSANDPAAALDQAYENGTDTTDVLPPQSWCMLESQNWVGMEAMNQANCVENPTDPSCSDPNASTANNRLANLYTDDVLCSDCFINMFYLRLISPYLPDTDHSDYLIEQYQDILDVCKVTTMPELVIRALPNYAAAPPPTINTTAASSTCSGQTIPAGASGCDSLTSKYGVTTGDLQAISGNKQCNMGSAICAPAACTVQQVSAGTSCASLATKLSISTIQLLTWNPNIMGICDSLQAQSICASAPGGSYVPPPPGSFVANAGSQNRGGNGVDDQPGQSHTLTPPSPTVPTAPASQIQTGISSKCTAYAKAGVGDYCAKFAEEYGVTQADLYAWNPVLGAAGANCNTQFWTNYYYCVAAPGGSAAPTPTPTQGSSVATPSPVQTGITSKCNKFAEAAAGDACAAFASKQGITEADLYAWNPTLGAKGANCNTNFWTKYYYCTGVSS